MSGGEGREGIIRTGMLRGRLGGRLAGLSLPQQIWMIAFWPLLEQLLSFVVTSTDLLIATRMGANQADTIALADGMGAIVQLTWLGFVMQGAVGMGATAIISRNTGARKFKDANHGLCQGALLGLFAGIASCILMIIGSRLLVHYGLNMTPEAAEYAIKFVDVSAFAAPFSGMIFAINAGLRGAGDTRLPFLIMLSVGILNMFFALTFVYAPAPLGGWHIQGIAAGTTGAFFVNSLVLLYVMHRRKRQAQQDYAKEEAGDKEIVPLLHVTKDSFSPDWNMQKRILSIGTPQAIEVFGMWAIQMYCLSIISKLPIEGALGVHNIAIRVESLSFLPGFAIGMAASSLVGQYLGARNTLMARITILKCMKYGMLIMGGMGVIFFLFPETLVSCFAKNSPELISTGVPVLRVMLLLEPFFAACIAMKMSLRGAGDTRRVMLITYLAMGIFRVGITTAWYKLSPETMTLWGIWLIISAESITQTIIFYKIVKGKSWTRRPV